jgi:hypothetical protein
MRLGAVNLRRILGVSDALGSASQLRLAGDSIEDRAATAAVPRRARAPM